MNYQNALVVVTGAGSGIGHAAAAHFAGLGARLALVDIDASRCENLSREFGERALIVDAVDVADQAAFTKFCQRVLAIGAPDVVINNAGVAVGGEFVDTTIEDWDWLMNINLRAVMLSCHYFAPAMIAQRRGHIINVSSVLGFFGAPTVSAYCASKFAVFGFSASLRAELAKHGVGVTALCPGTINTNIVRDSRMHGRNANDRGRLQSLFQKGADPARVARAMQSAIDHNQAVRPVGNDGWALWAISRAAPGVRDRMWGQLTKMFER